MKPWLEKLWLVQAGVASLFVLLLTVSCVTTADVASPGPGSVREPVRCGSPAEERLYLKRLRSAGGEPVEYRYLDSILGPDDSVLDRFLIDPPEELNPSLYEMFLDGFRSEPRYPTYYRIYMDLYHPGIREDRPPPGGYRMVESEKNS